MSDKKLAFEILELALKMNAVYFMRLLVFTTSVIASKIMISKHPSLPLVINTWPFVEATEKAWSVIYHDGGSNLDAVEKGCSVCEIQRLCGDSVGYGGHPDETGKTTLDAMIMDGATHQVGSVGNLKRVKNAISVARAVMDYTEHTLLVGNDATMFAIEMGFPIYNLETNKTIQEFKNWLHNKCQPNYRKNVVPDHTKSCGSYKPILQQKFGLPSFSHQTISKDNHDTIGMLVIDKNGNIAGGTTTNGMDHKVPGRVGDSPIIGSGAYVDNDIGGAVGTGDGDIMMRFVPSFHAVHLMQNGLSPEEAASGALKPIIKKYPHFSGAIVAASISGEYGAACHNFGGAAQYTVRTSSMQNATVFSIKCSMNNK